MSWAVWLQVIGWVGSALLIVSVLQTRFVRFRVVNSIACVVMIAYNWALGSWPQVAMNVALAVINVYFLVRARRHRDVIAEAVTKKPAVRTDAPEPLGPASLAVPAPPVGIPATAGDLLAERTSP